MDYTRPSWYSLGFTTLLLTLSYVFFNLWRNRTKERHRLPPGPPPWPIVGNLFQLGDGSKPTETFCELSRKYGPLMTLFLGMKTAVVVSSPAMAKEFLQTHDHICAGRAIMAIARANSHNKSSMIWGEYGPHWRKLRRISATELFSHSRLQALQHLRNDQIFGTIRQIFDNRENILSIGHTAFCISVNMLGNMIFSTSVFDPRNPASVDFKDNMWKMTKHGATPNSADFFPFLEFLDPQGICRRTLKYAQPVYDFFGVFIENRLDPRKPEQTQTEKDFLDVLLGFRSEDFTILDIRAFIGELFVAGTDTMTTTIEWAMAEILRDPQKMKRVQQELGDVVGDSRRVEESDIQHLPYLHAVVKEVFRLHPAAPLLLPHKAESSIEVAGFLIPKDTQVLVNMWAIGRDPATWKDPSNFMPERFMEGVNREIEFMGQDFELIPFGAGRRICPGLPLASRMIHLVLASLVHSFEWVSPDGKSWEEMDMSDEFGFTLKKTVELKAIPTPRLPHHIY